MEAKSLIQVPVKKKDGWAYAVINAMDAESVLAKKWYLSPQGYAHDGKVLLHRHVTGAKKGEYIDHLNHDTLDNRRCNLHVGSQSRNMLNQRLRSDNRSGYRGVTWDTKRKKWFVSIRKNGKTQALGRYKTIKEATLVYKARFIEMWGQDG